MPLFGKRKSNVAPHTPNQEQVREAAMHFLTVRGLWLDDRIDLAILGDIGEEEVFVVMADVHSIWPNVAAKAWRDYGTHGRGFLLIDSSSPRFNYYALEANLAPDWLPAETTYYCESYDPRTELVIAIYGFPQFGAPQSSAVLWVRPPDSWLTPVVAWQQWEQAGRS